LPHRVADGLRRGGRLVGQAADLGDRMLVGGGAGDEVQVAVIEFDIRSASCKSRMADLAARTCAA
jgi:hypothetical protein